MKVLGRGWQYTVYDLGNGRVRKQMNSAFMTYSVMLWDSFPYIHHPLWGMPRLYREAKKAALNSLSKINEIELESWMLANPVIKSDFSYEQDKVVPLCSLLKQVSHEAGRRLIDAFVECNKILVEKCCIDKSFDMGNNFGVDAAGRIVLIDLGELYCDQESINAQINKRIWTAQYVLSGVPSSLHAYFIESMDTAFSTILV